MALMVPSAQGFFLRREVSQNETLIPSVRRYLPMRVRQLASVAGLRPSGFRLNDQ